MIGRDSGARVCAEEFVIETESSADGKDFVFAGIDLAQVAFSLADLVPDVQKEIPVTRTIGYIVGSISSTSINRSLATALEKLAPEGTTLVEIPIKDLGFYSPDQDADYPQVARDFKQAIADVDGVLIITPEYSRSIPGVLKNALDWSARPWGQGSFNEKPVAVIGGSIGGVGTAAAQQHLRAILGHYNALTMGQPEGFIHITPGLITEDGDVTNAGTAEFLTAWLEAFNLHISRSHAALQLV